MAQPGLRVGVLLVDDLTLVWSPTPRQESAPLGNAASQPKDRPTACCSVQILASNWLMLCLQPVPKHCHSMRRLVWSGQPKTKCKRRLDVWQNPPIPVDLARITRVFSTKLQFAGFHGQGRQVFQAQKLKVSNDYMNADIQGDLKGLVESRLRAFGDFPGRGKSKSPRSTTAMRCSTAARNG